MQAIILAGGLGTRLKEAVPDLPKPMAPIAGRPFLAHQLDYWIKQGVSRFILAVSYRYETIQDYFKGRYKIAEIVYSVEKTPLGTGGGLLLALTQLQNKDSFLVLNGDTYFEVTLKSLHAFHQIKKSDVTFGLFRSSDKKRYSGMELDSDSRILSIQARDSEVRNGGVYLFRNPSILEESLNFYEKSSLEDELFPKLLKQGKQLFGLICTSKFLDIGIPEDYYSAESLIQNQGGES